MNLEQLRGFVEVAERRHFTRAAEALHLAQPSLSKQIATLEKDLGSELFLRVRGRISLTAAGEALLPYARRMLADAAGVRREMAELAGLARGRVRLGATPSLCASIVTEVVAAFHAQHPGVEIEISERGSRGLTAELRDGALDLALVTETTPQTQAGLLLAPLLAEELVVVSAASSDLVPDEASMSLRDLSALPQIQFHRSYDLRAATEAAFREAGLVPNVVLEGPEMDAVLRFVERGIGVAVVPAMVTQGRPGLRATRLVAPRLTRTIRVARRADVQPTRAAAALQGAIARTAERVAGQSDVLTAID